MDGLTPLLSVYRALSPIFCVSAYRRLQPDMKSHGISVKRRRERMGYASIPRPKGHLVWIHAVSIGESLSVLPLIDSLHTQTKETQVLLTTSTPTSANLLDDLLPPYVCHQFAPLDCPRAVRRFLNHWTPDAVVFVESELWPNLVLETKNKNISMALVNARLSPRSLQRWQWVPTTARRILSSFRLILSPDVTTREGLRQLGVPTERIGQMPSLKKLTPVRASPIDPVISGTLSDRPVWLAVSTHAEDEQVILSTHKDLLRIFPGLCLILAPRHPERAREIIAFLQKHGLPYRRRSLQEHPDQTVFLADTIGEMPLWYSVADFAFIGGSFGSTGGHNPYEALKAGLPVLTGPHTHNFASDYDDLIQAGIVRQIGTGDDLFHVATYWLKQDVKHQNAAQQARQVAQPDPKILTQIAKDLCGTLGL